MSATPRLLRVPRLSRTASTAHGEAYDSKAPTQEPPRPRFYALFPDTLPAGPPLWGPFRSTPGRCDASFFASKPPCIPISTTAASGQSESQATALARAEATSALINDAYRTLSSPLMRAQYPLREMHGSTWLATRLAMAEADPGLLMLVLEAREAIEEAQNEDDLVELRRTNDVRIQESEEGLGRAFQNGDIQGAKTEAIRLRYWQNIKESLDNWESGNRVVLQH